MSDSQRCRATAAKYQRLAELTGNADMRRSYLDLQRLWLEMASVTEELQRGNGDELRVRLYALVDDVNVQRQATLH